MALTTFLDYDEAKAVLEQRAVADLDEVLAGALMEDGTPVYFIVDRDISEFDMRVAAFEARYGKPMDWYQRDVLEMAMAKR